MKVVKEHLLFSATPWRERLYVDGFDRALSVGLNADGKPAMWYVADDEIFEMSTLIIIHTVFPDHEPGGGWSAAGAETHGRKSYPSWFPAGTRRRIDSNPERT